MATNNSSNIPTANSGTILRGQGIGTNSAFSTATYPDSTVQGDLLISSTSNTLTSLAKNTTSTRYLANTGTSNNPAWDQVNLTNGITGVLPIANGGTNSSSMTTSSGIITYNGSSLVTSTATIDSSNRYTNSSQPIAIIEFGSTVNNVTGDGTVYTIKFDTAELNVGNSYTTSTGVFTAPIAGRYLFSYSVTVTNVTVLHTSGNCIFVSSAFTGANNSNNPGAIFNPVSNLLTYTFSRIWTTNANSTFSVTITISGSTKTVGVKGLDAGGSYTSLSIALLD
jgi:hypothetical protein